MQFSHILVRVGITSCMFIYRERTTVVKNVRVEAKNTRFKIFWFRTNFYIVLIANKFSFLNQNIKFLSWHKRQLWRFKICEFVSNKFNPFLAVTLSDSSSYKKQLNYYASILLRWRGGSCKYLKNSPKIAIFANWFPFKVQGKFF